MYNDSLFSAIDKSHPLKVLIVKTSSLGDIIQSFPVLNYLHRRFPNISIDWAVEENLASIVQSHPLISQVIPLDIKGIKKNWHSYPFWKKIVHSFRKLREENYHLIFDLQANSKSGVITLVSRGTVKVGFGRKSVREWPNLLATRIRFEIPKQINIRLQHLRLLQHFFKDTTPAEIEGVRFKIDAREKETMQDLLSCVHSPFKVMVCPGSKWSNKQIPLETLLALLRRFAEKLDASFLLIWGADSEKADCEKIHDRFPHRSLILPRLPIPTWQNLMNEVDLVLAVDSSALHLCGTTSTPSFSIFGPTSAAIFKPIGHRHFAFEGKCPYGRTFQKTCPILRSCPTGACIRELPAEEIFQSFLHWWEKEKSL